MARNGGTAKGKTRAQAQRLYLLIMFLNLTGVPGPTITAVLQTYVTSGESLQERDRISEEMAAAYPDDHDFVPACQVSRMRDT